ncbi:DUF222 domain-containing protein [Nocardia uniformis]|uniref:DUF222 domain-containing protein n=2 Tax=Nocardia uniformis TaxID=53432 RepID=A0A849C1U8_9NOCA|nr:HNH endonuclease signature motif containing protein [Nocardia uniformis]NNH72692.1 DUF222 domain-containing protein [Nocardia uniformis]
MTMGEQFGEDRTRRSVAELLAVLTAVVAQPLTPLSEDAFVTELRDLETVHRLLSVLDHRMINETTDRSLADRAGLRNTPHYLMETLRLSRAEAWARFRAAERLGDLSHRVDGHPEPVLPHTATVQAGGEISADHARAVWNVMKRIPEKVEADKKTEAEQMMAEYARSHSPDDLKKIGDRILGFLDPDGTLTNDADRQRMREVVVCPQRPDGMSEIKGFLDPTLRAVIDMILAKWARPGMCNPADTESPTATDECVDTTRLEAAAARDTRTVGQRNHDALLAFLSAGGGPESLGTHRGLPVSVILTMSVTDLEKKTGVVTTASGGTVSVPEALQLAQKTHAAPLLAIFDPHGMPLHLGKARLANKWIRYSLTAAERGCTRPGCDAPATMCAVHHVVDWSKDGPTDIENLTFACDACHSLINDTDGGWATIKLGPDSAHPGRTGWQPPRTIDRARRPRVNLRHHPERVLSGMLSRHRTDRTRDRDRDRAAEQLRA